MVAAPVEVVLLAAVALQAVGKAEGSAAAAKMGCTPGLGVDVAVGKGVGWGLVVVQGEETVGGLEAVAMVEEALATETLATAPLAASAASEEGWVALGEMEVDWEVPVVLAAAVPASG